MHLAWPFRIANGRLGVVEQDTLDDVRQCVRILLRTPLGARPLAPNVGFEDPTFTAGIDPGALAAALMDAEAGEPRAQVAVTAAGPDAAGGQQISVKVDLADEADAVTDSGESIQA